jgi:hydrogenase maturation protein HypF
MTHLRPAGAFSERERFTLGKMLEQKLNTPLTSSVGRLFDGVSALVGLRERAGYEGQPAMDLEFALEGFTGEECYSVAWCATQCGRAEKNTANVFNGTVSAGSTLAFDWEPLLREILADLEKRLPVGRISLRFHNTLVEAIVQFAQRVGHHDVVLSGGCFQNKYLTEHAADRLERAGFHPHLHRQVPPNDGGIALGQIMAARRARPG